MAPAAGAGAANLGGLDERNFRDAFPAQHRGRQGSSLRTGNPPEVDAAGIADPGSHAVVADSGGSLVAFAQVHLRSKPPDRGPLSPSVEFRRSCRERYG